MADVVDQKTRSRMMSGIQGKNTRPELILRSNLHAVGYRFRLHRQDLPGKPDLTLPRYNAVIFVNGCFWHGHQCHLFKWPSTRKEWWRSKILATRQRDHKASNQLRNDGWRVLTVWECALKGKHRLPIEILIKHVAEWLAVSQNRCFEISGSSGARIRKKK